MLKSGGSLLYSTCTFAKEEDEDNIDYIINKYKDLQIITTEKLYPHKIKGEGQFYAILKKNTREKSKRAEDEKYIQKIRRSDSRARGDVLARIVRQEEARRRGQRDGDVVSGTYRIHGRADRRVDGASDGA